MSRELCFHLGGEEFGAKGIGCGRKIGSSDFCRGVVGQVPERLGKTEGGRFGQLYGVAVFLLGFGFASGEFQKDLAWFAAYESLRTNLAGFSRLRDLPVTVLEAMSRLTADLCDLFRVRWFQEFGAAIHARLSSCELLKRYREGSTGFEGEPLSNAAGIDDIEGIPEFGLGGDVQDPSLAQIGGRSQGTKPILLVGGDQRAEVGFGFY